MCVSRTTKGVVTGVATAVILTIIAIVTPNSQPAVRVLDPKFRVLTAKISRGTNHMMFDGPQAEGRARLFLSRALWRLVTIKSIPTHRTTTKTNVYAFMFRWTGEYKHDELMGVCAELADGSGNLIPLRLDTNSNGYTSANNTPNSGLGEQPWVTEYIGIWFVDSPQTSTGSYRLRLKLGTNEVYLAEMVGRF